MADERCGAGRIIGVEKEAQANRLSNPSFVKTVDNHPVGDGQHFVGAGIDPEHLKELIKRCERCVNSPTRECDINTNTFQHPEQQT